MTSSTIGDHAISCSPANGKDICRGFGRAFVAEGTVAAAVRRVLAP